MNKIQAILDENKEGISSALYLQLSNAFMEQHQREFKLYKLTVLDTKYTSVKEFNDDEELMDVRFDARMFPRRFLVKLTDEMYEGLKKGLELCPCLHLNYLVHMDGFTDLNDKSELVGEHVDYLFNLEVRKMLTIVSVEFDE